MAESHRVDPDRKAGRSFGDPRRPLGADVIERAETAEERGPTAVADRAKAVAVLRKAEEFMRTANPSPVDEHAARRALELAAGRAGIFFEEYRRIVRGDPELSELERRVLTEALPQS